MTEQLDLTFLVRDSKVFPRDEARKVLMLMEELGGSKALQQAEKVEIPSVPDDLFQDFSLSSITLNPGARHTFDLPTTLCFNGLTADFYRVQNSNPPGAGLVAGEGLSGPGVIMSDGRIRGQDGSLLNTTQRVVIFGGVKEGWIKAVFLDSNRKLVACFLGRWPFAWPQEVVSASGLFQFQLV